MAPRRSPKSADHRRHRFRAGDVGRADGVRSSIGCSQSIALNVDFDRVSCVERIRHDISLRSQVHLVPQRAARRQRPRKSRAGRGRPAFNALTAEGMPRRTSSVSNNGLQCRTSLCRPRRHPPPPKSAAEPCGQRTPGWHLRPRALPALACSFELEVRHNAIDHAALHHCRGADVFGGEGPFRGERPARALCNAINAPEQRHDAKGLFRMTPTWRSPPRQSCLPEWPVRGPLPSTGPGPRSTTGTGSRSKRLNTAIMGQEQENVTVVAQRHQPAISSPGRHHRNWDCAPPGRTSGLCPQRSRRIRSRSPPTLRAHNSGTVDPRFALSHCGGQRITAIPNFRAYTTAIRAAA